MKILILGGNSIKNKQWVLSVTETLQQNGLPAHPHLYRHWESGDEFIDIDQELTVLQNSGALSGEYSIIAKSMGAVLTLNGLHQGILRPTQCLLLGLPLQVIHDDYIPVASWLPPKSTHATFMQNEADPLGSYGAVYEFLTTACVPPQQIVMTAGDTHDYLELEKITAIFASPPTTPEPH